MAAPETKTEFPVLEGEKEGGKKGSTQQEINPWDVQAGQDEQGNIDSVYVYEVVAGWINVRGYTQVRTAQKQIKIGSSSAAANFLECQYDPFEPPPAYTMVAEQPAQQAMMSIVSAETEVMILASELGCPATQ
jgi:hypothetical protein